jgi:DNA uptake protein ComE-like DNA-binding protein
LALTLAAALPGLAQAQAAPAPAAPKAAPSPAAPKAAPSPKAPKGARPSRKQPLAKLPVSQMVNVNKANKEALGKLKGVTVPMAAQIIAMRPYRTKTELVTKLVVPRDVYEGIKHKVYAGQ